VFAIPGKRRTAQPNLLTEVTLPFPIGGINTVSPGTAMPLADCIYAYNLIASESGGRARLGWREHGINIYDASGAFGEVRTIFPFAGSAGDGSKDRLFAMTTEGIWDVTSGGTASPDPWVPNALYADEDRCINNGLTYQVATAGTSAASGGPTGTGTGIVDNTVIWDFVSTVPRLRLSFGTKTGDAGYGVSMVYVTAAGHFGLYFDEVNGFYVYTESTDAWTKVIPKATSNWAAATAYTLGQTVLNDSGKTYECTTAGTSAGSGGPTGTGSAITDNTVTWKYRQDVVDGVNPANLVFGMSWKNRLWAVERDTARAWYFGFNAIFGTATSFTFGTKFKSGGHLVGLWSWTGDGGDGVDDRLVAVSAGGDVVVFGGTDPSIATSFGMIGVWNVGQVPTGRRIATDYGGDLLVMSTVGVFPMSKLVIGNPIIDRTQYSTFKISNLFNFIMGSTSHLKGWSMHLHPEDNALLVTIPTAPGQVTSQLAMSLSTRGWFQYRDLPILSAAPWQGQLYFGTSDGRVCINTGYVDGVTLADPDDFSPIQGSFLSAYSHFGNARQKKVELIRTTFLTLGAAPTFQTRAKYRFDLIESDPVTFVGTSGGSAAWDLSLWDSATWTTVAAASQAVQGSVGMAPEFAVECRFAAASRTTLVGFDIGFRVGGFL